MNIGHRARLGRLVSVAVLVTLMVVTTGADVAHAETVQLGSEGLPEDFKAEETALPVGWDVPVEGSGWPSSGQVLVEVCGRGGIGGSSLCDLQSQQTIQAGPDGTLRTSVRLAAPPEPCPCVIKVTSRASGTVARTPIRILGHDFEQLNGAEAEAPRGPELVIGDLELIDRDAWIRWFGGPPRYTLEFTVKNISETAVRNGALTIVAGTGADPTDLVEVPALGVFGPGETRDFAIPIDFDVLTFGQLTISGELIGPSVSTPFAVQSTTYPWGLVLIPAFIIVQMVLLAARNRMRRRIKRVEAEFYDAARAEMNRLEHLLAIGELEISDLRDIAAHLNDRLDEEARRTAIDLTTGESDDPAEATNRVVAATSAPSSSSHREDE